MMRIGVDGRELREGVRTGIGRYVIEVVRAAAHDGCECIVYGDTEETIHFSLPNVAFRPVAGRWTPWWDQISLPRQLARDRVAVFLSPYYKGPLVAPCPTVLTIHDLFFIGYLGRTRQIRDPAVTAIARLYARRARAIISDSQYSKRAIITRLGVAPAKISVIPVALGAEFHPTELSDAVKLRYGITLPYILYVGNFKPHKNLPRLVRAYAGLPAEIQAGHRLVLAGGDVRQRPALESLVRQLGLSGRVLFPGPIEDSHLPALYSGCALFVLLSLEEGFGLPALEAMGCGAPVLAANRAALPEVVGEAALLVDPEDEAAAARAMAQVLSEPAVQEDLRRRGLLRARKFSPERSSGRVVALLREVCRSL